MPTPVAGPQQGPILTPSIVVALTGILISAMAALLNNRVGALALADIRGGYGFGFDAASWITTAFSAGELIAMPFSSWFVMTLSMRRFHLWMVTACALIAAVLPFVQDLGLLIFLRFLQGLTCGALIPILLTAGLKLMPASVRLYGMSLYALTATFAPNIAIWLSGLWTDQVVDIRLVYWQIIPLCLISGLMVGFSLPREPITKGKPGNWLGLIFGVPALGLIVIGLDQGVRLDWFNSPLIVATLITGISLLIVYFLTEWYHPAPFIKLQILGRRNLAICPLLFACILVVLASSVALPSQFVGAVQDFRPMQTAPIALIIALPQPVLGLIVAALLYQQWMDARKLFAAGLALIALASFLGAQFTAQWNDEQFLLAQVLQAIGQPMTIVSMLFLVTSAVAPHEGPYISGVMNSMRAFGALLSSAFVGQFLALRGRFHSDTLLTHAGLASDAVPGTAQATGLGNVISQQSLVLSVADAYRVLGMLALLLIPFVLMLRYYPPPGSAPAVRAPSA
ncbi:MFS transporter [Achromobacter pulmonis]|uniref:MFS transporter n=2 Tax=Achromobacter pulmonis TaxID=1389932 RepID=A0A2N8KJT4_9BURK|nr:MFS transporter [Achromobacter pulmonis]